MEFYALLGKLEDGVAKVPVEHLLQPQKAGTYLINDTCLMYRCSQDNQQIQDIQQSIEMLISACKQVLPDLPIKGRAELQTANFMVAEELYSISHTRMLEILSDLTSIRKQVAKIIEIDMRNNDAQRGLSLLSQSMTSMTTSPQLPPKLRTPDRPTIQSSSIKRQPQTTQSSFTDDQFALIIKQKDHIISNLNNQISSLQSDLAQIQDDCQQNIDQLNNEYEQKIVNLEQQVQDLVSKAQQQQQLQQQQQQQIQQQQQQLQTQEQQQKMQEQQYQQQLKQLQSQNSQAGKIDQNQLLLQQQNQDLQQENKQLNNEVQQLQEQIQQLQSNQKLLQQENQRLQQLGQKQLNNKDLQEKNLENANLQLEIEQMRKQLDNFEHENRVLKQQNSDFEAEIQKLLTQLSIAEQRYKDANQQVQQTKNQIIENFSRNSSQLNDGDGVFMTGFADKATPSSQKQVPDLRSSGQDSTAVRRAKPVMQEEKTLSSSKENKGSVVNLGDDTLLQQNAMQDKPSTPKDQKPIEAKPVDNAMDMDFDMDFDINIDDKKQQQQNIQPDKPKDVTDAQNQPPKAAIILDDFNDLPDEFEVDLGGDFGLPEQPDKKQDGVSVDAFDDIFDEQPKKDRKKKKKSHKKEPLFAAEPERPPKAAVDDFGDFDDLDLNL